VRRALRVIEAKIERVHTTPVRDSTERTAATGRLSKRPRPDVLVPV
jgi:hypothetical protein